MADKGCSEVVEGVWLASAEENDDKMVMRKIATYGKELTRWSKECFGNIRNELAKKRRELARVKRQALQGGCAIRLVAIKNEINSLMEKEERMWRQRSRSLYLKEGDRNTRFFHYRATFETLFQELEIGLRSGVRSLNRLLRSLLIIIETCLLQQTSKACRQYLTRFHSL